MTLSRSRTLALLLASALLLPACGGRVHLEDSTGQSFRRVRQAQSNAHPRTGVARATAFDVKLAAANRRARTSAAPGGGGSASGEGYSTPSGQSSSITPSSINLGPSEGDSAIRLQGK